MIYLSTLNKSDSLVQQDSLNPIQNEISELVQKVSNTPVDVIMGDLIDKCVIFGLKVLAAIALYFIGAWLIKRVKKILTRVFEKRNTDAAIASFTQSITSIALTIILIIIVVGTLGVDTSSIAALLTGGGLAIGMALNGTVQNFAGGIMILIFKPFKAGDFIEAQGYTGTVSEVTITSTFLTTLDNRVVIIPNGALSNGTVNNFSRNPLRRLDLEVNVEYGTSSEKTKQIMHSIIENDKRILNIENGAPADPFVALSAMKENGACYVIRVWVNSADYWDVNFMLLEQFYNELPKNGISFPFPKLDVNIKTN